MNNYADRLPDISCCEVDDSSRPDNCRAGAGGILLGDF